MSHDQCETDEFCGNCIKKEKAELQAKLDAANLQVGELAEALRDILADHEERVRSYPGAPEENPNRLRVMNLGRAVLGKTEKPNDGYPMCSCGVVLPGSGIPCAKCGRVALKRKCVPPGYCHCLCHAQSMVTGEANGCGCCSYNV